jgi:hypothetical protein
MGYQFMREGKGWHHIKKMAAVFWVSSSTYYKWAKLGVWKERSKRDAEQLGPIRKIVQRHRFRYGSPREREELRNTYGKQVILKKVVGVIRENGLNARRRGKFITVNKLRDRHPPKAVINRNMGG